jgi:hypothetical protein
MTTRRIIKQQGIGTIGAIIMAAGIVMITVGAFGHGGKHSGTFTRLQALQKATQLYDKLISNGKLNQSWETGLEKVTVSDGQKGEKKESVVEFHRGEGDPLVVYIFFDASGKYTGSNFTGE